MPAMNISNATIQEISAQRDTTLVTVTYREGPGNRRKEQSVRLVVSSRTIILNQNGIPVPVTALRTGMTINASFSSAMTRSIPPQAAAYIIKIVRREPQDHVTTGRILEIDQRNRSFTTINDRELSTIIRFNVSENARIFDRFGRSVNFSGLRPGMQVRVRHAEFMTASIPPRTTAFEIRVI